jgi:hypothetical protein
MFKLMDYGLFMYIDHYFSLYFFNVKYRIQQTSIRGFLTFGKLEIKRVVLYFLLYELINLRFRYKHNAKSFNEVTCVVSYKVSRGGSVGATVGQSVDANFLS